MRSALVLRLKKFAQKDGRSVNNAIAFLCTEGLTNLSKNRSFAEQV